MRFFAYDQDDGFTAHPTPEDAKADAEARHASWLEYIRHDGEHREESESTCWGVFLGAVEATEHHHEDDCPRGLEHAPDCEGCEYPGDCAREYCRDGCEVDWGYESSVTIALVDVPDPRDAEIAELRAEVEALRRDYADYEHALDTIRTCVIESGTPEETTSETGTTTRWSTPKLVSRTVQRLRAALADAAHLRSMYDADEPCGWVVECPETDPERFNSREDAEAFALEYMQELLDDSGEGEESAARVLRVVAHTVEVIGASCDDDTERGEWCRERGYDYEITGYKLMPGSGAAVKP